MPNATYTPGPWTFYKTGSDPFYRVGGAQHAVAEIKPSGRADVDDGNARLIAAAPDLLEVVRAVYDSSPGPQYKRWVDPDTLLIWATSALAKVYPGAKYGTYADALSKNAATRRAAMTAAKAAGKED